MLPAAPATFTTNLREACEALAPEDRLERALELTERERNQLFGRKLKAIDAALSLVSQLCAGLDADDEERPHRAAAEEQLAEVLRWRESPSDEGLERVRQHIERSQLVQIVNTKEGPAMRPAWSTQLGKVLYQSTLAVLADKPSDAAAHVRSAAYAVANNLGHLAEVCPVQFHAQLCGIVSNPAEPF